MAATLCKDPVDNHHKPVTMCLYTAPSHDEDCTTSGRAIYQINESIICCFDVLLLHSSESHFTFIAFV